MMSREELLSIVKKYNSNKNLVKHMIAVEHAMRYLARHFNEDEDKWAMAGLLHDLDYEETKNNFEKHGFITVEILKELGIDDEEVLYAITAHPGHVERKTLMDKCLYATDPLTGLIVASALMHPSKKLAGLDVSFVMRRFKEKRFAAGANRDQIKSIEETGLSLEEFIGIVLKAMQDNHEELGL